jgi:putative acetyltransferase
MAMDLLLRRILPQDQHGIANVIRQVMTEFGCNGPGYSIHDPEVDAMYTAYSLPGSAYWVIAQDDRILGGGGYAALDGGEPGVCELKKMYFLPAARGLGWGHRLMETILYHAPGDGYHFIYLETVAQMTGARALYRKHGFLPLPTSLGATGHHACDAFYGRTLNPADFS